MSRLDRLLLVLTTLALFCFAVQAVNAQTVIVGPSNDLSRYPIGLDPHFCIAFFQIPTQQRSPLHLWVRHKYTFDGAQITLSF